MKLSAVMVVRDEAPILPVNLAYHRALGVDEFWVIDNESSDETPRILESERRTHGDVRWRTETGRFFQSEMTTALAHDAVSEGADWILPVDADEFWWTPDDTLRERLDEAVGIGALVCSVDNFVQRRSVAVEGWDSLLTMTYRARPVGARESARDLVVDGGIAFIEIEYPPKLILRGNADLVIHTGNHGADGVAGTTVNSSEFRVLHAPIRSRSALAQRVEHGRRIMQVSSDPDTSWHLRRWVRMEEEGLLEDDWRANSQRFGWLHVGNSYHRLIRDLRLRRAVSRYTRRAADR